MNKLARNLKMMSVGFFLISIDSFFKAYKGFKSIKDTKD